MKQVTISISCFNCTSKDHNLVCGGIIFDSTGVIQSPGYPNRYSNSLECVYEIVQPLGKIIKMEFTDLDLETNSSPDCIYDFVEVRFRST
jgi:hypothetical protein